jgi:hypothetical protein
LADDRDVLGRGDVVSRIPVTFDPGGVEILFNYLLPPRQTIASAHKKIIADRSGILNFFRWKIGLADGRAHVSPPVLFSGEKKL